MTSLFPWSKVQKLPDFLCLALSARKNLCINEQVCGLKKGSAVDGACQNLTASFMRAKAKLNPDLPSCEFFDKFDENREFTLPNGVYNLVSALPAG